MDLGLPPLKVQSMLRSNPLKSAVLVCELTVRVLVKSWQFGLLVAPVLCIEVWSPPNTWCDILEIVLLGEADKQEDVSCETPRAMTYQLVL